MYKGLLICLLMMGVGAKAQGRLLLEEDQARKNLVVSKPPVIADGPRRTGKVVVLVQIGPDGRVTSAKADTGPSYLRDAAVDAVKQWRFKPFKIHDEKVTASTKLTIEFGASTAHAPLAPLPVEAEAPPAKVDETFEKFQGLEQQCRTLVTAHADPVQEVKACRAAADQAGTLKGENRFALQRSADVYAATALMRTDDLKLAVAYGSKAVKLVALGHDDDAGASAAYTVRGQAKAFAGDLAGADADLSSAEDFERKALAAAAGKPDESGSRAALKNLLLFHAQLLKGMKQPDKAAQKTAEATAL